MLIHPIQHRIQQLLITQQQIQVQLQIQVLQRTQQPIQVLQQQIHQQVQILQNQLLLLQPHFHKSVLVKTVRC